jgi:hypothetical protein
MWGRRSARSRSTRPGRTPTPAVTTPCSSPASNMTWFSDADAQHGTPSVESAPDDRGAADGFQARHAGGEGAHPGHHEAIGFPGLLGVGGQGDLRARRGQRAGRGVQVARPVVEHRDARAHKAPFVEGIWPAIRGSGSTADAQRPRQRLELGLDDVVRVAARTRSRCTHNPAFRREGLDHVVRHRPGTAPRSRRSGRTPERRARRVQTTYGRPATSTTQRASASSSGTRASPKRRMPLLVPQRLAHCLADHDGGVLHDVVPVDVDVAAGLDGEVDQGVLG